MNYKVIDLMLTEADAFRLENEARQCPKCKLGKLKCGQSGIEMGEPNEHKLSYSANCDYCQYRLTRSVAMRL